jgi:hypothetical protein
MGLFQQVFRDGARRGTLSKTSGGYAACYTFNANEKKALRLAGLSAFLLGWLHLIFLIPSFAVDLAFGDFKRTLHLG